MANHYKPLDDPQFWLWRAEEARTIADSMTQHELKQIVEKIAQGYENRGARWANPARPQMNVLPHHCNFMTNLLVTSARDLLTEYVRKPSHLAAADCESSPSIRAPRGALFFCLPS